MACQVEVVVRGCVADATLNEKVAEGSIRNLHARQLFWHTLAGTKHCELLGDRGASCWDRCAGSRLRQYSRYPLLPLRSSKSTRIFSLRARRRVSGQRT